MRAAFLALVALSACGNPAPHAELPEVRAAIAGPWLICDGVDAPVVYVFADGPEDQRTHLLQIDKITGQTVFDGALALGPAEGAAGSVYTTLLLEGTEVGAVRQINPGMLETPGDAYTPPLSSVSFRGEQTSCRWMPRTRLLGFTAQRSVLIYEGDSGDLIYTTYDFGAAAGQTPIELSNNGRTTTFSAEVREGEENLGPDGVSFSFTAPENYAYRVFTARNGEGRIEVLRDGALIQTEPLIAFQLGGAEE